MFGNGRRVVLVFLRLTFMKTKLFICLALFTAILIGIGCGEASAQSKINVQKKQADESSNEFYVDHHSDKDHQRNKKDGGDKDWDPKRKYDLLEKEIWEAVKAGKISEREGEAKLGELKKEMFGGHDKEHHHDHAEKHENEAHHEQREHGMDEVMIAVQVLKHAVETGRMEHHHAKDMLWDLLTGEDKEHHHHHEEERH
ncbi:MAG TPA: hypothetical protein DEB48_03215, partial [Verrucomicrobiales bacterium]|nr:hypothetical protein [Verrucomicrobiales bacterium]